MTPFKGNITFESLISSVNMFLSPPNHAELDSMTSEETYKFSFDIMNAVFDTTQHPQIAVARDIEHSMGADQSRFE